MVTCNLTTFAALAACLSYAVQACPVPATPPVTTAAAPPASSRPSTTQKIESCTLAADGFASLNGGTTGGAGGVVVTVDNQADLEKYAKAAGKHVIKVKGRITISPKGREVEITNDKTVIGIGATGEIYQGGFILKSAKNVIIRNLKIGNTAVEGDPTGETNDFDGIQMDAASNVWIDHVTLEKAGDGLIDSRKDTNFLTVSNCQLLDHNKAFGIGWTEKLVAEITIHHNYFHNTHQRNPSADNVKYAHLYNNYVVGITSYGHLARGGTEMRMENVYFEDTRRPVGVDAAGKLHATGNIYVNTTGDIPEDQGTVFDPSSFYDYTLTPTEDVPRVVLAESGPQANICTS